MSAPPPSELMWWSSAGGSVWEMVTPSGQVSMGLDRTNCGYFGVPICDQQVSSLTSIATLMNDGTDALGRFNTNYQMALSHLERDKLFLPLVPARFIKSNAGAGLSTAAPLQ